MSLSPAALSVPRQWVKDITEPTGLKLRECVGGSFVVIKWTVYANVSVCNFCCMLLMGMSWLLNGSEMRQFAPRRIMLSSAWAATHVLDNSQPFCSHTDSALLRNYCVLVLSPFKCHHVCAGAKACQEERRECCVYEFMYTWWFSCSHSNMCDWVPAGIHIENLLRTPLRPPPTQLINN